MFNYKEQHIYLETCSSKKKLQELRKNTSLLLKQIDEKISIIPTKSIPINCPQCRSSNTKKNGRLQKRSSCNDCGQSFSNVYMPNIFQNTYYPEKKLKLICLIYMTEKSTVQIIKEINISRLTYNKWREEITYAFPFLLQFFEKRIKTR